MHIGVIGAGQLGATLAEWCAEGGHDVAVRDVPRPVAEPEMVRLAEPEAKWVGVPVALVRLVVVVMLGSVRSVTARHRRSGRPPATSAPTRNLVAAEGPRGG